MDVRISRIDAGSPRLMRGALPAILLALLCGAPAHAASPGDVRPDAVPSPSAATLQPLLPPRRHAQQQALRAAVAAHPELLRPEPGVAAEAVVALALYPDGRLAASNLRFARPPLSPAGLLQAASPQQRAMREWLQSLLPAGGDAPATAGWARGTPVGGGQLAVDVTLFFARVPGNFDPDKSDARVRSIVSRLHRDLLFTGDDTRHRLTVLLDGDALVARHIDRIPRAQATQAGPQVPVAQRARTLASRLQVDVAQIGLMGRTHVQDGAELYVVEYAWQREAGESAPQVLQPLPPAEPIDRAVAQALVARHFPAASPAPAEADAAAPVPAIVLSMDGAVLRTGNVPLVNGGLAAAALQQPVLQQLRIADVLVQAVPGAGGTTRNALFVWHEGEPPGSLPGATAPMDGAGAVSPAAPPGQQATASEPPSAESGEALAAADVPEQALQALLRAHPEIIDTADRGGWHAAAVLLRADGSLFRSALRFAPDRAQAMRDILDQRYITDSATGYTSAGTRAKREPQLLLKRSGEEVGNGRRLQNHLVVQFAVLPAAHDEQRAPLKVWEAVAARHAALLLPREAPLANRVIVLLAEDGSILRERIEFGTPERMRTASADFTALGVADGDIGVRGVMTLGRNNYQDVEGVSDDQQMLRAALWSALGKRDELIVHYAWPRRPGEAAAAQPAASRRADAASLAADGVRVTGLRAAAAEALAVEGDTGRD